MIDTRKRVSSPEASWQLWKLKTKMMKTFSHIVDFIRKLLCCVFVGLRVQSPSLLLLVVTWSVEKPEWWNSDPKSLKVFASRFLIITVSLVNWRNYANAEFLLCISDISDVDFKHQAVKQPTRVQYYSIYYNVRLCMYVLYLHIVLSCV